MKTNPLIKGTRTGYRGKVSDHKQINRSVLASTQRQSWRKISTQAGLATVQKSKVSYPHHNKLTRSLHASVTWKIWGRSQGLLESLPQNVKVFSKTLQNWSIFSYIFGVLKFLEMVAKERSCFLYSHRTSMMYSILKRTGWLLKGAEFRFTSESNFQSVNLRIYLPSAETRLSLFNYFWATIRICENIS